MVKHFAVRSREKNKAPTAKQQVTHIGTYVDHLLGLFKGSVSSIHSLERDETVSLRLLCHLVHHHRRLFVATLIWGNNRKSINEHTVAGVLFKNT